MQFKDRLKQVLLEKSIQRGDFVLTSGKRSNYYLDARLTTLDAEGALCSGMAVLELLQTLKPYPKAIGGLTMGADPIVAVVAALSAQQPLLSQGAGGQGSPPISGFLVRKEPKKHGTQQYIEGWRGATGDPVVVVDDVCTTGGSTIKAIERAQAEGYNVVAAVCIVDREEGGREAIEKLCPFVSLFTARELLAAPDAKSTSGAA
jgi:orotate phosphoribosyltransferase